MDNQPASIKDKAIQEVIDLHVMIEDCFCNRLKKPEAAKKEFMSHFHPDFCMITPSGKTLSKNDLDNWFTSAIGTRLGNQIKIVNPLVRTIREDHIIVTFEEEQRFGTEFLHRISTAILMANPNSSDLVWLHLHETWIENDYNE